MPNRDDDSWFHEASATFFSSLALGYDYHRRGCYRSLFSGTLFLIPSPPQRLAQHVFHSPRLDRVQLTAALRTAQPC